MKTFILLGSIVGGWDDEPSENDFLNTVDSANAEHGDDIEDASAEMDDLELDDAPALASTNVHTPPAEGELQAQAEKVCISLQSLRNCSISTAAKEPQEAHA